MTLLIIGIIVMIGIHLVPAFPDVRERLIGQLGQNGYRLLFSVVHFHSCRSLGSVQFPTVYTSGRFSL